MHQSSVILSNSARKQLERDTFPLLYSFKQHKWRQWLMPLSMTIHYIGYEAARSASIALLSSKDIGLAQNGLSWTISIGTPVNALILYLYALASKHLGPRYTLRATHVLIILTSLFMAGMFYYHEFYDQEFFHGRLGKAIIILYYIFRESYVGLMATQQWAFVLHNFDMFHKKACKEETIALISTKRLASIMSSKRKRTNSLSLSECVDKLVDEDEESTDGLKADFVVLIGSMCSLASVCGSGILYYVSKKSMIWLFIVSMIGSSCSWIINECAAHTQNMVESEQKSGEAYDDNTNKKMESRSRSRSKHRYKSRRGKQHISVGTAPRNEKPVMPQRAWLQVLLDAYTLLRDNRTLQLLLLEAILHQACSNLMNLEFHGALRTSVLNDTHKVSVVSNFFAFVNIFACMLQISILPRWLNTKSLPIFLVVIPITIILAANFSHILLFEAGSLTAVLFTFGVMKTIEYSILTSAIEMIYMPLDLKERTLGKELVRFCGHKLGKTLTSIVFSSILSHVTLDSKSQHTWGMWSVGGWGMALGLLSRHLINSSNPKQLTKSSIEKKQKSE